MRVDFVGHATLLVRHADFTLLTDPWWSGPAYRGQWYPYPLPVPDRHDLSRVDAVYLSHAHEDHLHAETLRELLKVAPHAQAIIPRRYDTQMRDYLRRIGFSHIRELSSGVPTTIKGTRLTVMTHMDDSLLAVEASGETLLNLNDALHSARRDLIVEYCRILRRRWPRIEYLFCGFGGASYFPNCIHVPGKDDVAVARARETFFLENFALIAQLLHPRMAFPFAAHFVLPDNANWWISETRLRMGAPSAIVRRLVPDKEIDVVDLQPGDFVDRGKVHAARTNRQIDDPAMAREAVLAHYPNANERRPPSASGFAELLDKMRAALAAHASPADELHVAIALRDYPAAAILVQLSNNAVSVEPIEPARIDEHAPEAVIETRSDLISSTMRSPFGRDLITIGYGANVRLRSRAEMQKAPHDRLLALLSPPEPRWRERLRRDPLRTLGFVLGDTSMRMDIASKVLHRTASAGMHAQSEPALYAVADWASARD